MKIIKILLVLLALIFLSTILIHEKRSFYYNSDKTKCVTIWKRFGGKCLVIPKKYIGLFKPEKEYLETTNVNSLTIIWEKGGKYDLAVLNNYGFKVNLNFKNTKVKYYAVKDREKFTLEYCINDQIKPQFEYLMVNIGENWGIVNGKEM